jgi:aspartyl aminopeptidase
MSNLLKENKNGWETVSSAEKQSIFDFCEGYKEFIDNSKTERQAVKSAVEIAKKHGFVDLNTKETLKTGDKVYFINREKSVYLSVIGKEDITNGINFIIAHLDAPRIDIKGNPLYESNDLALLKTHYYGGLRKYQWITIPLSLIGVVYKKDGIRVDINIGENENDPVFYISDLAPHLAKDQVQKKMSECIEGENLNIILEITHCVSG